MNDSVYQELIEISWRRALTPQESDRLRAIIAEHPDLEADWQAEAALSEAITRLPEPAVASNFTVQVLDAVRGGPRGASASSGEEWRRWVKSLWPKMAWAALVLLLGTAGLLEYRHLTRARLARELAHVAMVASAVPSPEVLQDFDAVRHLSLLPVRSSGLQTVSDDDLLAALQ